MKYFLYCRKSTEDEGRQVLSIESQEAEAALKFANDPTVSEIVVLKETRSAKAPGRPVFDDMMQRIERGEASGIIAWAPDRLARNSIDGGRIIYDLDHGALIDLKFATYTFENNAQGKFMLQVMFGYSKYYSDALSENVKRGNRAKLARGWRPSRAPLGYQNDPFTKTTLPHPEHFVLVQRMFDMALMGASPKTITLTARDEWGLLTPKRKRRGGTALTLSAVYKILGNPFYAGLIPWNGQILPGRHDPAVSLERFEAVQARLHRHSQRRPKHYDFPFTGLIRCGSCGLMITAETKAKPSGRAYTYYHCTRRGLGPRCKEPSLASAMLMQQMEEFLVSIQIHPQLHRWALRALKEANKGAAAFADARILSLKKAAADIQGQIKELMRLRLRSMIDDEVFGEERNRLEIERIRIDRGLSEGGEGYDRFELAETAISFSKQAVDWFQAGPDNLKRFVVEIAGSNFILTGKKLSIQAAKPFVPFPISPSFLLMCGVGADVLTNASCPEPRSEGETQASLAMCGVGADVQNSGGDAQTGMALSTDTEDMLCPDALKPLVDQYVAQVLSALDGEEGTAARERVRRVGECFPALAAARASGPADIVQEAA